MTDYMVQAKQGQAVLDAWYKHAEDIGKSSQGVEKGVEEVLKTTINGELRLGPVFGSVLRLLRSDEQYQRRKPQPKPSTRRWDVTNDGARRTIQSCLRTATEYRYLQPTNQAQCQRTSQAASALQPHD